MDFLGRGNAEKIVAGINQQKTDYSKVHKFWNIKNRFAIF